MLHIDNSTHGAIVVVHVRNERYLLENAEERSCGTEHFGTICISGIIF